MGENRRLDYLRKVSKTPYLHFIDEQRSGWPNKVENFKYYKLA
jgi:hypothetical protein